ncbi:hypothetical protein BD560DRAFT_389632 [Blakeslea trispora]|nr:hypothetical protein BD560DRAFT_389632 [Blakeslea trispora]
MVLHNNRDREFAPLQTDEEIADTIKEQDEHSTPEQILDGLLTKVGYGLFQKKLLILCGFGWLADNVSNEN